MTRNWKKSKIDEATMKKNLQSKSHSAMRREILKDIVQWRKKEMAPKIKLTATQRRKLAKLEAERILKEDALTDPTTESTSVYGVRKIPKSGKYPKRRESGASRIWKAL